MNDHTTHSAGFEAAEPPVIPPAIPVAPIRRKRRWWLYVLIAFGGLIALAVILVVGAVAYWHSLIKTYTSASARSLPATEEFGVDAEQLQQRAVEFYTAVTQNGGPGPFKINAADLNALVAKDPKLKDHVRMVITNSQVLAEFSFPLNQIPRPELKNRHLNGEILLGYKFDEGWLDVTIAGVKANGKPIPKWILKQVRKKSGNLAKDIDKNRDMVFFMQKIDSLEVVDNEIVITPSAKK